MGVIKLPTLAMVMAPLEGPPPAHPAGQCIGCPRQARPGERTCLICRLKGIRSVLQDQVNVRANGFAQPSAWAGDCSSDTHRALNDLDSLIRDLEHTTT